MMNWREELETAVKLLKEELIAITVGDTMYSGEPVVIEEGLKRLDREFPNEFDGTPLGEIFWAWTVDRVFFVTDYDSVVRVEFVPRNPREGVPKRLGEG